MSIVQNPTYLLAPNWDFHPGGPITLGTIIVNPFRPHRPLTKPDKDAILATDTSTQHNWQLSLETVHSFKVSVWTVFLESIHLKAEINRERLKNSSFTMESLATEFLHEPTAEEIKARCNDPDVKRYMHSSSFGRRPVYMVTGLKTARGFALGGGSGSTRRFGVEAGGQIATSVSLGAAVEASNSRSNSGQFEAEGDIIFAYQLLRIKPKGWTKDGQYSISDYQPRQAFLNDEASEIDENEEVLGETEMLKVDELKDLGKEVCVVEAHDEGLDNVHVVYEKPKTDLSG
ncbi:hypothetical protein DL98DRAFT_499260 [Cadophora sp. DSE1049]|nr:hypothetical protein DL98DRAFT_499260 [Cadophora sp. DSE1049]